MSTDERTKDDILNEFELKLDGGAIPYFRQIKDLNYNALIYESRVEFAIGNTWIVFHEDSTRSMIEKRLDRKPMIIENDLHRIANSLERIENLYTAFMEAYTIKLGHTLEDILKEVENTPIPPEWTKSLRRSSLP